jgi:molybdate transport system regulatory protein
MAPDTSRMARRRQHVRLCIAGLALRSKRWIEVDGRFAIGEGGVELLKAVDATGSLAGAARHIGWSYRHAWGYVRRAEGTLGLSLIATKPGKGSRRGAALTNDGKSIIDMLLDDGRTRRRKRDGFIVGSTRNR